MINEQLLEYLYGEMDEKQRIIFKESLQSDESLQQELSELEMVRKFLDHRTDEKMEPARIVVQRPTVVRPISKWWLVAASLLVLLIAGKLLELNISWQDNQMTIAFGEVKRQESIPPNQAMGFAESLENLFLKKD